MSLWLWLLGGLFLFLTLRVLFVWAAVRRPLMTGRSPARTLLVLGSGGHTAELLTLAKKLPLKQHQPLLCVASQRDHNSITRVRQQVSPFAIVCLWDFF